MLARFAMQGENQRKDCFEFFHLRFHEQNAKIEKVTDLRLSHKVAYTNIASVRLNTEKHHT